MKNNKRKQLMESILDLLSYDPDADYFCEYQGRAYRFADLDYQSWKPKPGAQGKTRQFKRPQIFKIGNLNIHF